MNDDDGSFNERIAARYDESAAEMFDQAVVGPIVDFLAEIAGSGRALELGIGTGRIAIPLASRGVPVHGIELWKAMAAKLRAKPGGEDLGVTIGDFATTTVNGAFSLAYLVFNTIMNLTTQAAQVACFRNVAAHLEPGGCRASLQRMSSGSSQDRAAEQHAVGFEDGGHVPDRDGLLRLGSAQAVEHVVECRRVEQTINRQGLHHVRLDGGRVHRCQPAGGAGKHVRVRIEQGDLVPAGGLACSMK